jgi:membrane-associated HD superfamily phosphohydrolase
MTFIGIVLAMLVVLLSIGILSMFEDKMRFWNTREQLYLFLVIGFFESVLLLGLFEKLGGRWSRTTVVDTRSAESACIGATESTKPVPLPVSS